MKHELKTIGHGTLLVLEDGEPLIATDAWLIGSNYWRSWWLEKYPSSEEIDLVRRARNLYYTHSHPDHFHYPSLRALGKRSTLHPWFPAYVVPDFLESQGYPARVLEPWRWYEITPSVKLASIPIPIDDSILLIDTPHATIANVNDATPRRQMLTLIRKRMLQPGKPLIVLKSYSPASLGKAMFRDGKPLPFKEKRDYVQTARSICDALGATDFIPFASQVFFNRSDTQWANQHKVRFEDLAEYWGDDKVRLCKPFVSMDLETRQYESGYSPEARTLDDAYRNKIIDREAEEGTFTFPPEGDALLEKYLNEVYFLRMLFPKGVGFRLTSTGQERFYDSKTRRVTHTIPEKHDWIFFLPDRVLFEALQNNILTDLGVTMFSRMETKRSLRITYFAFLLMGMHDYGHFQNLRELFRFGSFYAPYVLPSLWPLRRVVPFLGKPSSSARFWNGRPQEAP